MERPRRTAVTSPQTRLAHARGRARGRWRVARLDPADAERAEELLHRQRRQAAAALLLTALVVVGLPVLLWARPALDGVRLLGVPASWAVIGALPYPAMAAVGFWQLRRAERIERFEQLGRTKRAWPTERAERVKPTERAERVKQAERGR